MYAHALMKLEQTRFAGMVQLCAGQAMGKKYHLLNRIERIMKTKKPIGNTRHILLAIALLTASVTGLAWLNPTIANGKISFNKIKPIAISELFTDTAKKKTVTIHHKVVATKKPAAKATQKEDDYSGDIAYNDAELERLSAEVGKYGEEIGKFYENPDYKKLTEQMSETGKQMGDFYNKPELKELQEKMQELSANFSKNWGDNSETTKLSGRMGELGSEIGKYYSTPEFKKLNEELEKKYGIPHDHSYSRDDDFYKSDNYGRSTRTELKSRAYSPAMGKETRRRD